MDNITINISKDNALVIFEFLAELSEGNRDISNILKPERLSLEILESTLESILLEPFEENYLELVRDARLRIESNN